MNMLAPLDAGKLSLSDNKIREACLAAKRATEEAVQKALFSGQLLNEKRDELMAQSSEKLVAWQSRTKADEDKFSNWFEQIVPEVHYTTAYRWMNAASRVFASLKISDVIDVEAVKIPFSDVISKPADCLPESAQKAQQLFLDFTANKTLKECLEGVLLEGDPDKRIACAANGLRSGGTNDLDDRKNYPMFAARKLQNLTTYFEHKLTRPQ